MLHANVELGFGLVFGVFFRRSLILMQHNLIYNFTEVKSEAYLILIGVKYAINKT